MKLKGIFDRHREVAMYLVFGVLTTFVGWGVYYAVMLGGRAVFSIPVTEVSSGRYFALYTAAQLIQWVCAVLFAFFTNRKWVFTDADRSEGTMGRQLVLFAGSRVASLGLDIAVTYGCTLLLALWIKNPPVLLGFDITPGIIAKVVAAVLVIIANYVLSKLFVFRAKKKDQA